MFSRYFHLKVRESGSFPVASACQPRQSGQPMVALCQELSPCSLREESASQAGNRRKGKSSSTFSSCGDPSTFSVHYRPHSSNYKAEAGIWDPQMYLFLLTGVVGSYNKCKYVWFGSYGLKRRSIFLSIINHHII